MKIIIEYNGRVFEVKPYTQGTAYVILSDTKHNMTSGYLIELQELGNAEEMRKTLDYMIASLNKAIDCKTKGKPLPRSWDTTIEPI